MIEITPAVQLDESELQYDFIRAPGPGGQNVNKVSTAVLLRFDVAHSPALAPEVKARLMQLAGSRVSADGVLRIDAHSYRTQEQNRFDALARLTALIRQALVEPKPRRPTRPSLTARAARRGAKQHRSQIKRIRRYNPQDWE